MAIESKQGRRLAVGLAFLAPNILGFLAFTMIPLFFSLVMAFTNWDLRLHNMFKDERPRFVELDNFSRLVGDPDFWLFLGNTLFLMMGIPFAIAGSLLLAVLLSKDLGGGNRQVWGWLIAGAGLVAGVVMLVLAGAGGTGMTVLLAALACGILLVGAAGGSTAYRTLFYLPHFTAGVAVFILWKHLYNPQIGPINLFLSPILGQLTLWIRALPPEVVQIGMWLSVALAAALLGFGLRRLRIMWVDGELGWLAAAGNAAFLLLPVVLAGHWYGVWAQIGAAMAGEGAVWTGMELPAAALLVVAIAFIAWQIARMAGGADFRSTAGAGFGGGLILSLALMTGMFVLVGLAIVFFRLPDMAAVEEGLTPPLWLHDFHWAKPSLMIMGFWAAVGSNNMLLYLAGLSNVPSELYEAADIDGASRFSKFWHVTWPQLAPTTFFIVVMSVIGGLQGGLEMVRVMTLGGPAKSTTTLSYFIYTEGFVTGRLGFSSAVAWTLFVMVFLITLFNWRFGSRYVND